MTDYLEPTDRTKCVIADAMKELHREDVVKNLLESETSAVEIAKFLAERFNGMRTELALFVSLLRHDSHPFRDLCASLKAVSHGDYGILIDRKRKMPKTINVEDAGLFAQTVRDIMNKNRLENRMMACQEVNAQIAEAIANWQSKVDKMRLRTGADGSSKAELAVAEKKITQFGEAIKMLKKRGSQVTDIYYDAKRQLQKFLAESEEKFTAINYNEKV